MIILVSYELKSPFNYSPLYEALKSQGTWWHYLPSTWLISTVNTPEQVFAAVRPYIGQNDHVLIIEVGQLYSGWLPKDAWDWIRAQQATEAIRKSWGSSWPQAGPPSAPPREASASVPAFDAKRLEGLLEAGKAALTRSGSQQKTPGVIEGLLTPKKDR